VGYTPSENTVWFSDLLESRGKFKYAILGNLPCVLQVKGMSEVDNFIACEYRMTFLPLTGSYFCVPFRNCYPAI
jgi:hypothetical protein